jgi:predicted transcriptional regulator
MQNFHVPLSDETWTELKHEARKSRVPATRLAREALEEWLALRRKQARDEAIRRYAEQYGGGPEDLDEALVQAGVEHLVATEE